MTTYDIRTTMRPDVVITVDQAEYEILQSEGVLYTGPPPPAPTDYYDALFADKLINGTATPAAARGVVGGGSGAAVTIATTVTASGALVVGKHNPVDATGAAKTMTLPTGAATGTLLSVEKVDSSANAVTVTGNIRGVAGVSVTLPWAHETLLLAADSAGSWWPIAGHKTKSSLDAAYKAASYQPTAANISDSTSAGRSLLTATDVAAVKAFLAYAAQEVLFAGAGIVATDVQGAILELFGYADDAGDYFSKNTKTLNVNAGTYTVDADLNVPVLANQAVRLEYFLSFSGATCDTANLRAQILAPTGATAKWGSALDWNAAGSAGTAKQSLAAITDTRTFKLNVAPTGIHITAVVINGPSDGTVSIQLAPDTTTASAVIRDAMSSVAYSKAM